MTDTQIIDPALISAGAGFLGAIIGAGAALWSQFITQNAITERERRERVRKEERVRALFATRLEEVQAVVHIAVAGIIWDTQVADAYTPLAAIADDASFMLCLTPDEIYAVAQAVAAVKLTSKSATDSVSLFKQQREKATSGEAKANVDEQPRLRLRAHYSSSYDALNVALVQFGRKAVPRYEA